MSRVLVLDPATISGWAVAGDLDKLSVRAIEQACAQKQKGRGSAPRATVSGVVKIVGMPVVYGTFDAKHQAKTKTRDGEPKYYRLRHLYQFLVDMSALFAIRTFVFEESAAFQRGKAAIESAHQYRAVIQLFVANTARNLCTITPQDVKRFALGKGTGGKDEMVTAAREKYGYKGNDDNEADALHIMAWYLGAK